jgi:hypothetical protein
MAWRVVKPGVAGFKLVMSVNGIVRCGSGTRVLGLTMIDVGSTPTSVPVNRAPVVNTTVTVEPGGSVSAY